MPGMYIAKLVMTLEINRTVFYPEKWMLHNRKEKCKCDKPIIYCKYLQLLFLYLFVISVNSQMFSVFWNDYFSDYRNVMTINKILLLYIYIYSHALVNRGSVISPLK